MGIRKQRISKITIFCWTLLFMFGLLPFALAGSNKTSEDRDVVVDNAIGGMKEGSRILSPEDYERRAAIMEATRSSLVLEARMQALPSSQSPEKSAASGLGDTGTSGGASSAGGSVDTSAGGGSVGSGGGGIGDTGAESGGSGESAGGLSGGSGATLIDADAGVNLDSGTVNAGVVVDTNAGIQDSTILDADLAASGGGTGADVSSAIDTIGNDITADSGLVATGESVLNAESDLVTEIDTSGDSVGSEADVGVEADVEGASAGDDIASDPADGLSSGL